MELYNKETLKALKEDMAESGYYLPKALFHGSKFGNIRLETKLAYVAILDTLLKKPNYNQDNLAFIKVDNPVIASTLATLANKEVDQAKVEKYLNELDLTNLVAVENKDVFVYQVD